ncbi:MAG: 50S ribosomal protein L25 [bacterium]
MAENVIPTLKAVVREPGRKSVTKQVRASGKIPAVYYHGSTESINLEIDQKDFIRLLQNRSTLINLEIDGQETRECMIREIQRHPVSQEPIHLDFIGITRGKKITATVPIKLLGIPDGVRNQGGILQQVMHEVDIRVLPSDMPNRIEVDVTGLKLGESIHLDHVFLEGVEWEDNPEQTVATVVAPRVIEEVVEEEVEEAAEPELIGEKKEEPSEGEGEE